jgi:hypothetical protein
MGTYRVGIAFLFGVMALGIGLASDSHVAPGTNQAAASASKEAAEPLQPAWVMQARPVGLLIAQVREMARQMGRSKEEDLAKQFDKLLEDALGKEGLKGLDLNRPWGSFGLVTDDWEHPPMALVLPISEENEFLDLLRRLKIQPQPVSNQPRLYQLKADQPPWSGTAYLRVLEGGWAYMMFNLQLPWEPKVLPRPEQLWRLKPEALVHVRVYPQRVPPKMIPLLAQELENNLKSIGQAIGEGPAQQFVNTLIEEMPRWFKRNLTILQEQADYLEASLQWDVQHPAGAFTLELICQPRAGSLLAQSIAQRGASRQRFAGLAEQPKTALMMTLQPPQFTPEFTKAWGQLLEAFQKQLRDTELPKELATLLRQLLRGWQTDFAAGHAEIALLVREPNAQGHYSLGLAVSCSSAQPVEKALRQLVDRPPFGDWVQLDDQPVGQTKAHRLKFWSLLPAEIRDLFERLCGESPPVYLLCGTDALYVAIGPEATTILQQFTQLQSGAGSAWDWRFQPKHLVALAGILTGDEEVKERLQEVLGQEARLLIGGQVQLHGGQQLKLTLRLQDRFILSVLGYK